LDAMARRGLYDHIGGGFARYSVDATWHVPHFEKMLYDQAQLARAYFWADRAAGGRTEWRQVATSTLDFVRDNLRVASGYAASLDADAGGVEGSHVTWTEDEVRDALQHAGRGGDLARVLARWRLGGPGEVDGRHVPRLGDAEPFSTPPELLEALAALRAARARRPAPGRDDKVVLEWNAMFAGALLASRDRDYERAGCELLESLSTTHRAPQGWWRTESPGARATAHDLAWMSDALIDAFEVTGDDAWIERARAVALDLIEHHWDGPVPSAASPHEGFGLVTPSSLVTDLALRPKELFDGATPAAHSVATRALARLALISGDADTLAVARRLVDLAASLLTTHPLTVPVLVDGAGYALDGVEVVVPGVTGAMTDHVRSKAMMRAVLITGSGSSPLLAERRPGVAYLCRAGVCQTPVESPEAFDELAAAL